MPNSQTNKKYPTPRTGQGQGVRAGSYGAPSRMIGTYTLSLPKPPALGSWIV